MSSEAQSAPLVIIEDLGDGISRLTLNRVAQRNAMSVALRRALIDALDACRTDSKVVILTGAGPAFCAGIDLKEWAELKAGPPRPQTQLDRRSTWEAVQEEIKAHPAVVIASVNGYALGGGSTLINTSDLAVAANEAKIGMPEISFGVYPGLAGPAAQFRISPKRAALMILTADRIDGQTAERWGLVNYSVPREQLAEATLQLAGRVAQFDQQSLKWAKRAIWDMPNHAANWSAAFEHGLRINDLIRSETTAFTEGMDAFTRGEFAAGQGL